MQTIEVILIIIFFLLVACIAYAVMTGEKAIWQMCLMGCWMIMLAMALLGPFMPHISI